MPSFEPQTVLATNVLSSTESHFDNWHNGGNKGSETRVKGSYEFNKSAVTIYVICAADKSSWMCIQPR